MTLLNGVASSGVLVQRTKTTYGDDGSSRDVSASFPLPAATPNGVQTGTLSANGGSVVIAVPDSHASWFAYLAGTFSAGTALQWQGSYDGTNWVVTNGRQSTSAALNDVTNVYAVDFTGPGPYYARGNCAGFRFLRVVATAFAGGDSVSVAFSTSAGSGGTFLLHTVDSRPALPFRTVTTTSPATVATASGAVYNSRVVAAAVTTGTNLVLAPGAGLSIYVTDFSVSNSGTALSVVSLLPAGGTAVLDLVAAGSGGGGTVNLNTPVKLAANTALQYAMTVATTSMYVNVSGYVAA